MDREEWKKYLPDLTPRRQSLPEGCHALIDYQSSMKMDREVIPEGPGRQSHPWMAFHEEVDGLSVAQ